MNESHVRRRGEPVTSSAAVELVLQRRQALAILHEALGIGGEQSRGGASVNSRSIQRPAMEAAYARGVPVPTVCLTRGSIITRYTFNLA